MRRGSTKAPLHAAEAHDRPRLRLADQKGGDLALLYQLGRDADASVGTGGLGGRRVRPPVVDAIHHDPNTQELAASCPGHSHPGRITTVAAFGVSRSMRSIRPRSTS